MRRLNMVVRDTISTFGEKVDRLERSSLWRFMTSGGWKVSWDFQVNRPGAEAKMPDLESLEAYILNLRFFIQDNERTSLRNMASLYRKECKLPQYLQQFGEIQEAINRELGRETWFKFNDQTITYGKLLEGMVYSRFAHANKKGHELLQQMAAHPFGYMLAMDEFLRCLGVLHVGLVLVRNLNRVAFPEP
jgi:hypothetical protein